MPNTVIQSLKAACKGLLYPSETDAPFTTFTWNKGEANLTPAVVRQLAQCGPDQPIEEMKLADFFCDLTAEQDWHGPKEKADVKKFRALEHAIQANLSDACVFRIGRTKIDVYIVGRTADDAWAGVKTHAVET